MSNTNPDGFINPTEELVDAGSGRIRAEMRGGLTKREYFAAMAMQGILASDQTQDIDYSDCAIFAVKQADTLIAELNKERQ